MRPVISRIGRAAMLLAVWTLLTAGKPADDGYEKTIQEWRKGRIERLTGPTGYLTLVGLYWLHEGAQTVGSDSSNGIVFPGNNCPAVIGTIVVESDEITFETRDGVEVTHEGKPVRSLTLYDDHNEQYGPTVLELGSLSWYVIKRGDRRAVRLKDSESPTRKGFAGIDSYPIDRHWRVEGILEPYPLHTTIPIVNVLDQVLPNPTPGTLVFEIDGRTYRLDAIGDTGDKELFIIFGDETNGTETYSAGRFLYVDAPGKDGKVVIDFNKAYNPPCAFNEFATCPLPPRQNVLPIRVTAGEKMYGSGHH